jgi:hypothetical protein
MSYTKQNMDNQPKSPDLQNRTSLNDKKRDSTVSDDCNTMEDGIVDDNHDRTLSQDFYTKSPSTQAFIKDYTHNTTPTSSFKKHSVTMADANMCIEKKYRESNPHEREIMAFYGIVSMAFHKRGGEDP